MNQPIDPDSAQSARATFLDWEKFRLAYNLILVAVVLSTCCRNSVH